TTRSAMLDVAPARATFSDITSASTTTITLPAAGPKRSAAAMVNVSEMEKLIGTYSIRRVDQPVTMVRPSSRNQVELELTGCCAGSSSDHMKAVVPAAMMAPITRRCTISAASVDGAAAADAAVAGLNDGIRTSTGRARATGTTAAYCDSIVSPRRVAVGRRAV